MMSATVFLSIPGLTEVSKSRRHMGFGKRDDTGVLSGIPKNVAEKFYEHIRTKVREASSQKNAPTTIVQQQEDPMKLLQTRFVKGEITKDEFEEMKKMLE